MNRIIWTKVSEILNNSYFETLNGSTNLAVLCSGEFVPDAAKKNAETNDKLVPEDEFGAKDYRSHDPEIGSQFATIVGGETNRVNFFSKIYALQAVLLLNLGLAF